jgi:hypothetical protein
MQHKKLPEPSPTRRMGEYKKWTTEWGYGSMRRIHLYLGGLFDSWDSSSRYYVHCGFTETANSILTIIWNYLCSILSQSNPDSLTITMDGKVTGMIIVSYP